MNLGLSRWALVAGAAAVAACAPAAPPAPPLPVAPSNWYSVRQPGPAQYVTDSPIQDVAKLAGIPVLDSVTLPAGTRELRISEAYAMFETHPVPVLRIVERMGRPAIGTLVYVWQEPLSRPPAHRATRCMPYRFQRRVCVWETSATLEWSAIAAHLDSLGAWTMQRACERPGEGISDAPQLYVHRLDGPQFSQYYCNAPGEWNTEGDHAAKALYLYLDGVARRVGPPPPPDSARPGHR